MTKQHSSQPSADPSEDDKKRTKEELLAELSSLRRQYVNLKIIEYQHDQALAALKESQEKYRQIVETASDIIYRTDARGYFTYANHAAVRIIGYSLEEIIGRNYLELMRPDYRKRAMRHYSKQTQELIPTSYFEFPATTKSGSIVWLGQNTQLILQGKKIIELQSVARDITAIKNVEREREQLEQQLRQAQKMETVGRLAGGISHDFNNILGIILAYASILRQNASREALTMSIDAIEKTIGRAKAMIRELLTLARKTEPSLEHVDINDSVREFTSMIMETFPRSITFDLKLAKSFAGIDADPNQFQQLLLNLYVNARDAMPHGGTLRVTSSMCDGDVVRAKFREAEGNLYIHLSIADTGVGMDESTRQRIFEPFFSTKEHGKGSGLGLAVVYGIVHSHRGFIDVDSELGNGAHFHLYFPKGVLKPIRKKKKAGVAEDFRGTETILVVEDEELLRSVIANVLEEYGYTVLVAPDGISAVEVFMKHHKDIAVVLSDLGLPKLGGWEACVTMREIKPGLRIVLASGFIEPHVRNEMVSAGMTAIIQKPYVPEEVLKNIRRVLEIEPVSS